ncbi:hypothetical protein CSKR_110113 [Clonorchis sinensis]|uniref:Uncharacterized protein n=1 Tax=Clonorchis sinensis TaxID=79923 RepID=A0A3R7C5T2_CLOSI|nr:hypothetical protein CSKR_110113 [Clonorchis sinensis]
MSNVEAGFEIAQWLRRELTDQKVCASNAASAPRLLLSRAEQLGSTLTLVLPLECMTPRRRKGGTTERLISSSTAHDRCCSSSGSLGRHSPRVSLSYVSYLNTSCVKFKKYTHLHTDLTKPVISRQMGSVGWPGTVRAAYIFGEQVATHIRTTNLKDQVAVLVRPLTNVLPEATRTLSSIAQWVMEVHQAPRREKNKEGRGRDLVLAYYNHSEVPTPPDIYSSNLDRN